MRLQGRVARMTLTQSVITVHHEVVAHIVDLGMILLPWFDVDALESPVIARGAFRAVHPRYAIPKARAGEIDEVDVIPPNRGTIISFPTYDNGSIRICHSLKLARTPRCFRQI